MFRVDVGSLVGLVGESVSGTWLEECIIGIEHLSSEDLEPFSCYATCIHSLLVVESDTQLPVFDLLSGLPLEILETILENAWPTYVELESAVVLASMGASVELLSEIVALVVEVQNTGVMDEERERPTHERWVIPDHQIQDLPIRVSEAHEQLFH